MAAGTPECTPSAADGGGGILSASPWMDLVSGFAARRIRGESNGERGDFSKMGFGIQLRRAHPPDRQTREDWRRPDVTPDWGRFAIGEL